MKRFLKALLVTLVIIGLWILKTLYDAGQFKTIIPHNEGISIDSLKGIPGTEDLTIDQQTGIAFLSSDDRWAYRLHKKPVKGAIYGLNLNDSISHGVVLTTHFQKQNFHPHGLSLFTTPNGQKFLFVINHQLGSNLKDSVAVVERFAYRNDSLVYLETISDPLFISPNDLVAVGERQFYLTNDHDRKADLWRTIGDFLQLKGGFVVYFDGQKASAVSDKMQYANGINADSKRVFVAASSAKEIYVFDRNVSNGVLTLKHTIELGTGPDNIELDAEGNLWIGCHPQLLKFISHADHPEKLSPSQVVKINAQDFGWKEIYLNDGRPLSASSVVAIYKNKMLIGPVFQDKVLVCRFVK